jgi:hypothetical protein
MFLVLFSTTAYSQAARQIVSGPDVFITPPDTSAFTAKDLIRVKASEVKAYINKKIITGGHVFQSTTSADSSVLLDVTGDYIHHDFTILIKKADRENFEIPERRYTQRLIKVTGKVIEYEGKPVVCISNEKQIFQARPTNYIAKPLLHKFDGTWECANGDSTFRVVLKTEKVYNTLYDNYIDFVLGSHLYIKNGTVIQNAIGKQKTLTYGSYLNKKVNENIVRFIFTDLNRTATADTDIELLPNGKLKWTLKNRAHRSITVEGKPVWKPIDYTLYVPTNLILTKVN